MVCTPRSLYCVLNFFDFWCGIGSMPPRRRRVVNEREESEGNPGFTLEDVANLFTQQLNGMMPNIITQVAQALNVAPSDREEGSGTHGRRNEESGPRNEEEGGPRMEGGGEDHGPRNEDHIAHNTRNQTCTFKMFTSCNPPKFSGEEGAVSLLLCLRIWKRCCIIVSVEKGNRWNMLLVSSLAWLELGGLGL